MMERECTVNRRLKWMMAIVALVLLVPSTVALAKNYKFTFEDVTLDEGESIQGVIEAASKISQPNKDDPAKYTTCQYYTTDYETYLGQFASDAFFSDDGDEVKAFCLDHYKDRE